MVKKINIDWFGNIGLNYDLSGQSIITHAKSLLKNKKIEFVCGIDKSKKQRQIFKKI